MFRKTTVFELRRYVLSRHRAGNLQHHELFAALHKDVDRTYEAISTEKTPVCVDKYASWFDMLKAELPYDLQFGWLVPKLVKYQVTSNTTHNLILRYYNLMVAPESVPVVKACLPEPDQALADLIYREVWNR